MTSRKSSRISLSGVMGALPDIFLSAGFLITWISPYRLDDNAVKNLRYVVVLEVCLLGLIIMIYVMSRLIGGTVLLTADDYSLVFFGLGTMAWTILLMIGRYMGKDIFIFLFLAWFIFLSKYLTVKSSLSMSEYSYLATWRIVFMVVFCFLSFSVVTNMELPRLGITDEVIAGQKGFGLFPEEPHQGLAWGFIYFLAIALSELVISIFAGGDEEEHDGNGAFGEE